MGFRLPGTIKSQMGLLLELGREKVNCILTFSLWIVFVRIEPLEKHVIQWLQVGSVSIAYDSDFYSSGNCSFRLFCIDFTQTLIHPVFPYGKSPHAVDTRPKSEVFFKWAEARRFLSSNNGRFSITAVRCQTPGMPTNGKKRASLGKTNGTYHFYTTTTWSLMVFRLRYFAKRRQNSPTVVD